MCHFWAKIAFIIYFWGEGMHGSILSMYMQISWTLYPSLGSLSSGQHRLNFLDQRYFSNQMPPKKKLKPLEGQTQPSFANVMKGVNIRNKKQQMQRRMMRKQMRNQHNQHPRNVKKKDFLSRAQNILVAGLRD